MINRVMLSAAVVALSTGVVASGQGPSVQEIQEEGRTAGRWVESFTEEMGDLTSFQQDPCGFPVNAVVEMAPRRGSRSPFEVVQKYSTLYTTSGALVARSPRGGVYVYAYSPLLTDVSMEDFSRAQQAADCGPENSEPSAGVSSRGGGIPSARTMAVNLGPAFAYDNGNYALSDFSHATNSFFPDQTCWTDNSVDNRYAQRLDEFGNGAGIVFMTEYWGWMLPAKVDMSYPIGPPQLARGYVGISGSYHACEW